MILFKTIKFKMTLWYVAILGIILSCFSLFLYFTLADSLYKGVDNKIRTMAEIVVSSTRSPLGAGTSMADLDQIMTERFGIRPLGRFIQILDESGRIGDRSPRSPRSYLSSSALLICEFVSTCRCSIPFRASRPLFPLLSPLLIFPLSSPPSHLRQADSQSFAFALQLNALRGCGNEKRHARPVFLSAPIHGQTPLSF